MAHFGLTDFIQDAIDIFVDWYMVTGKQFLRSPVGIVLMASIILGLILLFWVLIKGH
jgi:hypothetical protein